MAISGTNYTAKWELSNGVLTISPISGGSGIMRSAEWNVENTLIGGDYLNGSSSYFIQLTEEQAYSIEKIIFEGSIRFQQPKIMNDGYEYIANLGGINKSFFSYIPNLYYLDVTGLDTTSIVIFHSLFRIETLTTLIGLSYLNTSSATNYGFMFYGCKLPSIDISSFSNINTAKIDNMFKDCYYTESLILPIIFDRDNTGYDALYAYSFGITDKRRITGTYDYNIISATKNNKTILSDEDFFKTDSQGGTWYRDVSGSGTLSFTVTNVEREANNVSIKYKYITGSTGATASIYIKESSSSSYPSTPTSVLTFNGAGNSTTEITVTSDSAYDMQIIVEDGTTTIYTFPSVDSNILLLEIDNQGNLEVNGGAVTKGHVQAQSSILDRASTTAPSSSVYGAGFYANDKNGDYIARFTSSQNSSNGMGALITGAKEVNGTVKANGFFVYVDESGDPHYWVTNSANFRSDMGCQATLSTTSWTPTITRSSGGTISGAMGRKYGNIVTLRFIVTYSTECDPTVSNKRNAFVGTLSNTAYRPPFATYGTSYYGNVPIVCQLSSDGSITCRVTGTTKVTLSSGCTFGLTYIID